MLGNGVWLPLPLLHHIISGIYNAPVTKCAYAKAQKSTGTGICLSVKVCRRLAVAESLHPLSAVSLTRPVTCRCVPLQNWKHIRTASPAACSIIEKLFLLPGF